MNADQHASPLDGEGQCPARSQLVADVRRRLAAPDRAPNLIDLAAERQRVAGLDDALEATVVDAGEEGDPAAVLLLDEHRNGACLGHRLDDQNTGHDRPLWKVARKPPVLGRHPADRDDTSARLQLRDLVHEQERIAMREDLLDHLPPERGTVRPGHGGSLVPGGVKAGEAKR